MSMNFKFARWSSLRGIGQSRAATLTVLVPLIGWIILLNDSLANYLNMINDLFQETKGSDQISVDSSSLSRIYTLSNMYFLYFGLTLIGVASFIFKAFCPRIIKEYSAPSQYVEHEEKFITAASVNLLAEKTSLAYLKQDRARDSIYSPAFTSHELQVQMDAVVNQMHLSGDLEVGDTVGQFVTPMDTPIVDDILEEISANRRVSRALVETFRASAREMRSDFMMMEYFSDDVTRWITRMIILIFYIFGFLLLTIPTVRTLYKILKSAF